MTTNEVVSADKNLRQLLGCALIVVLAGCPAPTPGERMARLNGKISHRGNGVIDLDLSGSALADSDFSYVNSVCSNDRTIRSIHTLNLSDTAITDQFLQNMALQKNGFTSPSGIEELILSNTEVSDAAIREYQRADPDCRIVR